MLTLTTEIIIQRPASHVWAVLMDFENYAVWNPFIVAIAGHQKLGGKLQVSICQSRQSRHSTEELMQFNPTITTYKAHQSFHWQGKLWAKGIFDGKHKFELSPHGSDCTHFIQEEDFSGLLVPFFKKILMTKTQSGFQQMNQALKQYCESVDSSHCLGLSQ